MFLCLCLNVCFCVSVCLCVCVFVFVCLCVRQVASSKWLIFDLINTRVSARFTIAPRYQTTPVIRCVLVNYRLIRYYWGGGGLGCVIWIQMVDINNQRIGATKTRWRRQTIFFLLRVLSETQKDSCFIWIWKNPTVTNVWTSFWETRVGCILVFKFLLHFFPQNFVELWSEIQMAIQIWHWQQMFTALRLRGCTAEDADSDFSPGRA